jgi:dTMP kinase
VYLDTPISECLKRIDTRDNGRELFERQEFLEKVRDNYEFIFSDLPKDVVLIRIDGCKAIDHITDEIIQVLRTYSLL